MSLRSFKETLRPCSRLPPSAAADGGGGGGGGSTAVSQEHGLPLPRRPPKSSLSQQLHRLDPTASFAAPNQPERKLSLRMKGTGGSKREDREEGEANEGDKPVRFHRERVLPQVTVSYARGPLEPLVLSVPGESPVVQVPASINSRLLEHQREGVRFLYNLYKQNNGGILGDDMGLGKTIQTIAFLAATMGKDNEHVDHVVDKNILQMKGPVLIVCPTSVIRNWENEFSEWGDFTVAVYHGANRDLILEKLGAQGIEILITSFDTFRIHDKVLLEIPWVIVIVDEAHRLKNEKSQLYKSCLGFKTRKRFGLTGTIMQNKISELFNLFDWVSPGSLGTREHFREYYDEPLKHGQRLSAPERFVQVADERKKKLNMLLAKYLLRRTKEDTIGHLMLGKEDNVVFCAMSELQKRVYKRMLEQPDFQCLINKDHPCSCGSPLKQVECCKRTVPHGIIWSYLHKDDPEGCDSCPYCLVLPCLTKLQQISNHLELIKPNPKDEQDKQRKDAELTASVFGTDIGLVGGSGQNESFMGLSDAEHCGKMRALEKLLSSWTSSGDKILLFSYSVRMLNILEKFLIRKGYCFSRLDGSTPMSSRQSLVDEFNRSPSKQVFLISTRAGGLGLNLVSANRVVIFDPNWNPAQDLQAQDRSFRFGQKRHVVVFRLLAAGSLEEIVYSRQVYKQQLSNIAVSGKLEKRYFEGVQDSKAYQGELFGISNLFRDLSDKLFTSEIIELHEMHGKMNECLSSAKDVEETEEEDSAMQRLLTGPGLIDNPSQGKLNKSSFSSTSIAHKNDRQTETARLGDLGILYAHRNEDVVNTRPQVHGVNFGAFSSNSKDTTEGITVGVGNGLEGAATSSKERKLKEYNLVAQFMGMGVLEFSKWLLSTSRSELNELLENYKEKKQRLKDQSFKKRRRKLKGSVEDST